MKGIFKQKNHCISKCKAFHTTIAVAILVQSPPDWSLLPQAIMQSELSEMDSQ